MRDTISHFFYRMRGPLMVPPYLFLLGATFWEYEHPIVSIPLGGLLFGVGLIIRIWAQIHLHYRLKIHKELTTTGPYAYVRNPIYIANILFLCGLTVLSKLMWFLPIMFVWCVIVYNLVIRYEESHLTAKYGESYREYLRKSSRWIPSCPQSRSIPLNRHNTSVYLLQSIMAESYCFLYLLPVLIKLYFFS